MKNLKLFSLAILQGITMSAAHAVDDTSPYINPQRDCLTEGMISPEGKPYRFLFSRDCRVVHVLPPAVLPQNIKSTGLNLQACEGVGLARSTITTIQSTLNDARKKERKYEAALEEASPSEARALTAKLEALKARIAGYEKAETEAQERFKKQYESMPGAKFAIVMDGDIGARDLNELRALNHANLNRRKTIIEKVVVDGKETVREYDVVEQSSLRPAQIHQSYFSFLYNVPADAGVNGGVISTDIPNLQYLEQGTERNGVIHVRAGGGVTGQMILSVVAACDHTKVNERGVRVLDESTDPFFIVNRTFTVQQMYAQGYEAELNVSKVVNQITSHVINHTEQGFKKSSVFTPVLNADVDSLMNFRWTTSFDPGKNISQTDILEIKKAVAAKLVDDYIEKLKEAGAVTVQADRKVEAAQGGYVDEARRASRCWSERDGGLSGVFGGRHTVCGDYTYSVKVWKDGVTEETINRSLTLSGRTYDAMTVDTMTPFYFTTAFTK